MGFMDKLMAQAETAVQKAQQGVAQGQAKVDELQAKRAADKLLRDLGAAVYAQQRAGGPADAVTAALAALDAHVGEHGPIDTSVGPSGSGDVAGGGDVPPAGEAPWANPPQNPET